METAATMSDSEFERRIKVFDPISNFTLPFTKEDALTLEQMQALRKVATSLWHKYHEMSSVVTDIPML